MTNILLVNKSPVSLCKTGFKRPPFNILTMSDEAKSAILCYHYFIHREEIYMTGEVLPSTQSQAQTGSQLHVEIQNMPLSWSFPPVPHTGPVLWARRNLPVFLLHMTSSEGILQTTPVLLFPGYRNHFRSQEVYGNFRDWTWLSPVSVQYFNHTTHLAIVSHRNPQMQETDRNLFLLTACYQDNLLGIPEK